MGWSYGITVRQALEVGALRDAKVVAGEQGLENIITLVNIMEVPEVTRWLKGGELLVTAGFALKENAELWRGFIYDLAAKGVAAFGMKPGQYFDNIPEDMIEYANEIGMPLIELPRDLPYMDFMVPIFEILISDQLARLKKTEQIHNRLLEIVLNGNGLPSVCHTLVELVGNPVLILDGKGDLLANAWPPESNEFTPEAYEEKLLAQLVQVKDRLLALNPHQQQRLVLQLDNRDQSLVLVRIDVNGSLNGFLAIPEVRRVLDSQDMMAVEHASTIVALEFLKQQIVYETEKQIRVELLEDIISGNFRFEEDVIRRAGHLNFNLTGRTIVFILQFELMGQKAQNERLMHQLKKEFYQFVQSYMKDVLGGSMLLTKSDSIIGLVRIPNHDDLVLVRKTMPELKAKAEAKWPKLALSIGIGRSVEAVRQIKKSYEEAMDALRIAGFMYEERSVTFFEDLGPFSFLFELEESSAMHKFCERTLGPVFAHDRQNNSELIMTLRNYFLNDCNLRIASEQLFIHKNTVLYRIRKVEELTGLKFSNPEHRFNLQLGLKLMHVLQSSQTKYRG